MKSLALIVIMNLLFLVSNAIACDNGTGFFPESDLRISVDAKTMKNTMTKSRFNQIINRIDLIYRPIIKEKGGKLKWRRNWKDGKVNASANQWFSSWIINLYGGLARHEFINDDAFSLVICHELGHHLGGIPQVEHNDWSSSEGQSDYFAALKCFRRIFENDDNDKVVLGMKNIPKVVKKKCDDSYTLKNDIALCIRSAMAGKRVADLLAVVFSSTSNPSKRTSFLRPDKNIVETTNLRHPAAQCRLDTYFQASLCQKNINEAVSYEDYTAGTCNRVEGATTGARPLCWYKPKD